MKVRKLLKIRKKKSGRDNRGRVSVRHQGGAHKRYLRIIDWKRNKKDIPGKVVSIIYDPNRNVDIALVVYPDGEKRYILSPADLKVKDVVLSGEKAAIAAGNALPLKNIPSGIPIHNIEIIPGKGGQIVRSAGNSALIQSKEKGVVKLKLPSGEMRVFHENCWATIGQLGNINFVYRKLKKAGDNIHRGIRPTVRGVAQHPDSHPHGGGEGRSPVGMKSPKSPWGKRTLGKKTRKKNRYSNHLIISRKK